MNLAFLPGMSGPGELILVFLVILLLFGGKKLPGLARALGKSLTEFKKGKEEGLRDEALEVPEKTGNDTDKQND